ncbi:MAG: hydantoinase B/oxoprolinase family protein [Gammaproteobacteria bacterium]|nr:MAG: hydantoinase B/oxoprolinase family protein [Gammaproteobacteria bacterium]
MKNKWKFWIDRGGTFTDIVACDAEGALHTHKLLSENPEQYPDAAIAGIRHILSLNNSEPIPASQIDSVRMGTTVATNALLEHKGTPTVLVITEGFADALRIGYQNRPEIFALDIQLPDALYDYVVEIPERISASGVIEKTLDSVVSLKRLQEAYEAGYRSCAIVLMHGYHTPQHEQDVAKLAGQCGFEQISLSSVCSPLPRLVSRGDTTVADAYLSPILSRYVNQVQTELGDIPLLFMQSSGGLCHASAFDGKDAVLSGPAGGVVGGIETARRAGFDQLIGFDMGGTSTDVWHYAGDYEHQSEHIVAGIRLRTPMMRIHTVAAGGGSILHYDDDRFQVGPDSAGANPGPASYRRGGPLCITDCNVLLGKIQPVHFPSVFGAEGDLPLDKQAVTEKFTAFSTDMNPLDKENQQLVIAEGFLTVAIENMTQAIRKISVQRGYDISRYTLCVFGGAGGQHACLVADALGMKTIYCHPMAGVLSAYGIGLAAISTVHEVSIGKTLTTDSAAGLHKHLQQLRDTCLNDLKKQGEDHADTQTLARLFLRYPGSDTTLELPFSTGLDELIEKFTDAHRLQFGYSDPASPIIIESLRVTVSTQAERPANKFFQNSEHLTEAGQTEFFSGGRMHKASIVKRTGLPAGHIIKGPAIITESTGTLIIEPGWQAEVVQDMAIVLTRINKQTTTHKLDNSRNTDPVLLEIFNRRFMAIAEQMGLVLERTSHSVNIKERMDFSCALFTPSGDLIANAPHIPVHLGSMSDSVRAVIEKHKNDINAGDSFILNNPYQGGTHLPDITVITPVFEQGNDDMQNKSLLFFVASRGHHADIGGITPGSMPATSQNISEEGILLDNIRFVKNHRLDENLLNELLTRNQYPARKPEQNIADLRAQLAANHQGISELHKLLDEFGSNVVGDYMSHVLNNAEMAVRKLLGTLDDGKFSCEMDNGAQIHVSIKINREKLTAVVDFNGTSEQLDSNFNAPASVCRAAVLYVFRCLVNKDIPLNEGCLRPLELRIPDHSFINPAFPAAVVAGNVETSQIIVDCLFAALGVMAASQGTMNNFTFGNEQFQYYETLCGGTGAGPDHHGTSAVHSHMTNSRLTDPEILEQRFPVQLEYFRVRNNSGGKGKFNGGDGVERCLRFHQPVQVSILANRRQTEPFGLAGGKAGACGENWYIDPNGKKRALPACAEVDVPAGGSILIRTPGGGGFGGKL